MDGTKVEHGMSEKNIWNVLLHPLISKSFKVPGNELLTQKRFYVLQFDIRKRLVCPLQSDRPDFSTVQRSMSLQSILCVHFDLFFFFFLMCFCECAGCWIPFFLAGPWVDSMKVCFNNALLEHRHVLLLTAAPWADPCSWKWGTKESGLSGHQANDEAMSTLGRKKVLKLQTASVEIAAGMVCSPESHMLFLNALHGFSHLIPLKGNWGKYWYLIRHRETE